MATQNSVSQERRTAIENKVRRRVELEKKAFEIVKHLSLINSVTEEELIDFGQHITRDHYCDVTEERSIDKLCGYPLCSRPLENVTKQKYKISLQNKAVYDLTERKKFCSNCCYEASRHFQNQISESPTWMRETEPPVKFTILHRDETQTIFPRGRNGEVVLESPWNEVSEVVQLLKLDDAGGEDATQAKPIRASEENPKSEAGKLIPTINAKTHHSPEVETKSEEEESHPLAQSSDAHLHRQANVKEATATCQVQQDLSLFKTLTFIREWKSPQTVEFFHPTQQQPSDYGERVLHFLGTKPEEEIDDTSICLAPVDHCSQHTQRRRIVMGKLNHVWPKLEMLLGLDLQCHAENIRNLIYTFQFTNKNILFKPAEWILVGYILLKMLDVKRSIFGEKREQANLKLISITEKELSEIVQYMTSYDDMEMVY